MPREGSCALPRLYDRNPNLRLELVRKIFNPTTGRDFKNQFCFAQCTPHEEKVTD